MAARQAAQVAWRATGAGGVAGAAALRARENNSPAQCRATPQGQGGGSASWVIMSPPEKPGAAAPVETEGPPQKQQDEQTDVGIPLTIRLSDASEVEKQPPSPHQGMRKVIDVATSYIGGLLPTLSPADSIRRGSNPPGSALEGEDQCQDTSPGRDARQRTLSDYSERDRDELETSWASGAFSAVGDYCRASGMVACSHSEVAREALGVARDIVASDAVVQQLETATKNRRRVCSSAAAEAAAATVAALDYHSVAHQAQEGQGVSPEVSNEILQEYHRLVSENENLKRLLAQQEQQGRVGGGRGRTNSSTNSSSKTGRDGQLPNARSEEEDEEDDVEVYKAWVTVFVGLIAFASIVLMKLR